MFFYLFSRGQSKRKQIESLFYFIKEIVNVILGFQSLKRT